MRSGASHRDRSRSISLNSLSCSSISRCRFSAFDLRRTWSRTPCSLSCGRNCGALCSPIHGLSRSCLVLLRGYNVVFIIPKSVSPCIVSSLSKGAQRAQSKDIWLTLYAIVKPILNNVSFGSNKQWTVLRIHVRGWSRSTLTAMIRLSWIRAACDSCFETTQDSGWPHQKTSIAGWAGFVIHWAAAALTPADLRCGGGTHGYRLKS